jgi:hypothetical protein
MSQIEIFKFLSVSLKDILLRSTVKSYKHFQNPCVFILFLKKNYKKFERLTNEYFYKFC